MRDSPLLSEGTEQKRVITNIKGNKNINNGMAAISRTIKNGERRSSESSGILIPPRS